MRAILLALSVTFALSSPARAESPLPDWADPVTTGNIFIFGMSPTEIVRWQPLGITSSSGAPLAVAFAKETTTEGETVLDEVLATKHSVGIYLFRPNSRQWMPLWERVTGRLGVDFVEDYDLKDVTGDEIPELLVRIRYYGPARALDFIVKGIDGAQVKDVFEEKSIYRGEVTSASRYIVIKQPMREPEDFKKTEVYRWQSPGKFEKIREIREKEVQ